MVLTDVWMIQDLHYFDFSEELRNRQTRWHVIDLFINWPHHVGPTDHHRGADSWVGQTIRDQAPSPRRKWNRTVFRLSHLLQAGGVQLGLVDDLYRHLPGGRRTATGCQSTLWCVVNSTALQSHLSSSPDVASQLDFGEVALPDGLEQAVVPHVRRLVRRGRRRLTAGRAHKVGRHLTTAIVCGGMLGENKIKQ